MLQKYVWKPSIKLAQDKGKERLFTLNNVSWTLHLCSVLYSVQQLFPISCQYPHRFTSVRTDKIVMDSFSQVILKKQYKMCMVWSRMQHRGSGHCLGVTHNDVGGYILKLEHPKDNNSRLLGLGAVRLHMFRIRFKSRQSCFHICKMFLTPTSHLPR